MISAYRGGSDDRLIHAIICDLCRDPIVRVAEAVAVVGDWDHGESMSEEVLHVHKSECLDLVASRLGTSVGSLAVCELREHLARLVVETGGTLGGIIRDLLGTVGVNPTPEQEQDLQRLLGRINRLF